jgi:Family of unknown function (DUF5681)
MSAGSANTGRKQAGRFLPGHSGNPCGKPKGARHKTTLFAEKLMSDDAEAIVKAVVVAAKAGDLTAAKIVLDRIAPPRKDSPVAFDLPAISTASDAKAAMGSILAAVAAGELSPSEGAEVAKLLDAFTRTLEATEFERRLQSLEGRFEHGR